MVKQLSAIEQLRNRDEGNKNAFKEMKKAEEAKYYAFRDQAAQDIAFSPARLGEYLNVQAALFRMGTANALAVTAQRVDVSVLKTIAEWRNEGRFPKENETPILIRQKAGNNYTNVVQVYDIQQTEGRYFPLSRITLDERTVIEANQALYTSSSVQIAAVDNLEMPAFFDPAQNTISVRSNLTHTELFRYLPYELALSKLPREGYSREAYHLEATSAAYIVHKHFGAEKLFEEYGKKTKQEDFAKMPDFANMGQAFQGFNTDEIISSLSFVRDQSYTMCNSVERALNQLTRSAFSRTPIRPSQVQAR